MPIHAYVTATCIPEPINFVSIITGSPGNLLPFFTPYSIGSFLKGFGFQGDGSESQYVTVGVDSVNIPWNKEIWDVTHR